MALGVAVAGTVGRADAAFIARFRTLGPELATAIEALMAERDALAEALDFCGATAALGYRGDPNRMLAALERILVEVRTARRALARKVE